jgi:ABC-2 type transport system permease protein
MRPETSADDHQATRAIARETAKRAARSGALWGVLFGGLVANEALGYRRSFPTTASREEFARTLGSSRALAAIIGPARDVGTLGGFVAWRVLGLLSIVGAIWGLLTATRLTRREEDTGRWELWLAGRTDRRHAAGQAIVGLAIGWLVLWTLTAIGTTAAGLDGRVGFPVSASLFYATAATAGAAMFLAVGVLASQLATPRRNANGLAAAAFAVFYVIRMIPDAAAAPAWVRWISPLGWVENLAPLTRPEPFALVPIVLFTVAAAATAVVLAGRRDLDAAILARRRPSTAGNRLLTSHAGLVVYLERWVALAWIAGLGALAFVFGVTARSAAAGNVAVDTITLQLNRLGGKPVSPVAAWIGYEFIFLAALLAYAAAGQIAAMRAEEADGRLDNLLVRDLSRVRWLAGRLGFGAAFVVWAALAAAVGAWLGAGAADSAVGLADMMRAGLNAAIPALFVLGLGVLLFSVVPRLAAPVLYAVVLWSFLVEIVGSSITGNHWLLDTALLTHLGPVPATGLRGTTIAWLAALTVLCTATGCAAFNRRDLSAA